MRWGSGIQEKGWEGLNNAAIYSFSKDIVNSFVREMIQNSNDARDYTAHESITGQPLPIKVRMSYKTIPVGLFPAFENFYTIFRSVAASLPNKVHARFFNNAFGALGDKRSLRVFIYEDYNTTGLSGNDNDPNSTFSSCVLSEGTSVKEDETAGGSFGIGKNAIFSFSKLRTVLYSSFNNKNEYIFQGVAKLASYYNDGGTTVYGPRIFCGIGEEYKSTRDLNSFQEDQKSFYKRDKPGLTQIALCPIEDSDWLNDFTKAVLRNYWMLIHRNGLIVELMEDDILKVEIRKENLQELMIQHYNSAIYEPDGVEPKGNPYNFYNCMVNGATSERELDLIGKVKFHYMELDDKNTNCVAYMRHNMVVFSEAVFGFGSINYCGVFECVENKGNAILRSMEPPTHDHFSPDILALKSRDYDKRDGLKLLRDIKEVIRKSLQTIIDRYKKPAESIEWIDQILGSLTGNNADGIGGRTNTPSRMETPEKMCAPVAKSLEFHSDRRNAIINKETGEIQGIGGGTSIGSGGGPGSGGGKGSGRGPGGGPTGRKPSKKSSLDYRIYKTGGTLVVAGRRCNIYNVFINSEEIIEPADVLLSQKGDSGEVVSFQLVDVQYTDGNPCAFSEERNRSGETTSYRLKSVCIPSELKITVDEPFKSSFKLLNS